MTHLRGRPMLGALLLAIAWAAGAGAQPANDDCANATVITSFPFTDTVDRTTATTEPGDSSLCGAGGTHSIWYRVPAGAPEVLLRGTTGGSTGTMYVGVGTGACGALVQQACFDPDPMGPLAEFGVAANGQEVLIEVKTPPLAATGTFEVALDVIPEFLVDEGGGNDQTVAGGPTGFLAVWDDTPGMGAQLFDSQGSRVGSQLSLPAGFKPDASGAGDGSFFVVWDGTGGARIDGPGTVVSLPPRASSGDYPVVAADADGDFVVAWEASDGSSTGIFAQHFDRDGVPHAPAFQVNTYTTSLQDWPAVAMAPTGEFVIVWGGAHDGTGDDTVAGRLYDASGAPVTGEFIVTSADADGPGDALGVGMDTAGNFVVAWDGGYSYGPGNEPFYGAIVARRFDSSATPFGGEFLVSSLPTTYYEITGPVDLDIADSGEFLVTWEAHAEVASDETDVWARRFEADGTPDGPQFLVNTFRGYAQYNPDVAATPAGEFMVVWNDFRGFRRFPAEENTTIGRVFRAFDGGCAAAALAGCRTPTVPLSSKLLLGDESDDTNDQVRWKFVKGEATSIADIGDPTADQDYVLCMYDATSPAGVLLMENRIPGGGTCGTKPCWTALGDPPGSAGYRYKSKLRTPHGISKMVVKPGADGKSKIVIKGGQDDVFSASPGAPALPLSLPVTVQLQSRSGTCWQTTYDASGVGTNEAGFYKGSGS